MSKKVDIKRGSTVVAVGEGLEFHGEWMQHGYVTVTVKSAVKIDFQVGDYVEYRGERFYLWSDENVKKQARSGSHGEAFVYENLKLMDATVALEQVSMHDFVLGGSWNTESYSSLGRFSFFGGSVDDLADRIQANLLRQVPAIGGTEFAFRVFTPSLSRTLQRLVVGDDSSDGGDSSDADASDTVADDWEAYYDGDEETGKSDVTVGISDETLWGALARCYNDFELPFYVHGTDIVIGGKAVEVGQMFAYGKDNGLKDIERMADQEQRIVTRLFAYGSTENVPLNYYGNVFKTAYVTGTADIYNSSYYFLKTGILFEAVKDALGWSAEAWRQVVMIGNYAKVPITVSISTALDPNNGYSDSGAYICAYEESEHTYLALLTTQAVTSHVTAQTKVYMLEGVDLNKWPSSLTETAAGYAAGMAIQNLMLPGFPTQTLADWVLHRHEHMADDGKKNAWLARKVNYNFSEDAKNPWIQSKAGVAKYGVREGEVYFDGSDDRDEIKPTIENTSYGYAKGVTGISDNGWVTEGGNFKLTVYDDQTKFWGAVFKTRTGDKMPITMTSGYHNGREFEVSKVTYSEGSDFAVLEIARVKDERERFVPNTEEMIALNDTFIATGIQLPDTYITEASEVLFDAALDALDEADHATYTHTPHIDEIFMARERDEAAANETVSLHDTIRPGMVLEWQDVELGNVSSVIDSLTIKDDGNNGIPTYEVVLRNEKEKTLAQMIGAEIKKSSSGGSGRGEKPTAPSVASIIEAASGAFLSKTEDDTAQGTITFAAGVAFGDGSTGIDDNGDATLHDVTASGDLGVSGDAEVGGDLDVEGDVTVGSAVTENNSTTYGGGIQSVNYSRGQALIDGNGWKLWLEQNGLSRLEVDQLTVRLKAYFAELEIRKVSHAGGNLIFSAAASKIDEVVPESISGTVVLYRCYLHTDDGTTATMNDWRVGDQALCQTFNVKSGVYQDVANKRYWRKVLYVHTKGSSENDRSYVSLAALASYSGQGLSYDNGVETGTGITNDIPAAGDTIVLLGHQYVSGSETEAEAKARQNAIAIEANSDTAPAIYKYQGIDSFSMSGRLVQADYYDSTAHKYQSVTYGNWYVGAKPSNNGDPFSNDGSTYIRYRQAVGSPASPLLEIKAKIEATSGSPIMNEINSKARIFTLSSTDMASVDYQQDDIWILPEAYDGIAAGTILVCVYDKDGSLTSQDWQKKDRYTDDAVFNTYISQIINGTSGTSSSAQVAQAIHAIKTALNENTSVDGGLILTNLIAMREDSNVWAGISGQYDNHIAAWFGGLMKDYEALTAEQKAQGWSAQKWAKSLFRFDGSGYLAGGNVSWEDDGDTTVKGTIKADNLFHSVCYYLKGNYGNGFYANNVLYYFNISEVDPLDRDTFPYNQFNDGEYYTLEQIKAVDAGLPGGEPCFIATTGKADVVMCMPDAYNWDTDYDHVTLPDPEDFQGKIVEVTAFSYGSDPSSMVVSCVCTEYNNPRMVGLVSTTDQGKIVINSSLVGSVTISTGGVARFLSVEAEIASNVNAWVWVLLANQTGGDVYVIGDGGSIGGGTVTSVGMSVPTGFSVSPSTITTNGTFAITFASGYALPTTADVGKGVTAYNSLSNYLPLSGGAMVGDVSFPLNKSIVFNVDSYITNRGTTFDGIDINGNVGIKMRYDQAETLFIGNGEVDVLNSELHTKDTTNGYDINQYFSYSSSLGPRYIFEGEDSNGDGIQSSLQFIFKGVVESPVGFKVTNGTSSQFLKADGSSSALSASDIPDISATYATKSWVDSQSFVTESAFSGMLENEAYISDETIYLGGNSITPITDGDLGDYVSVDAGGMYSHPMKTQSKVELHKSIYGNGCIEFYGGTTEALKGSLDVDNNGNLRWTANSATKRVLLAGDANNIPLHDSNGNWSGGITSMSGLVGYFHYVNAGVYELDYLPKSGGTISSTLTIATGGDRKLVLNNTDNELWNIISFQQNGTEVGYLGLCGSNALAWNGHDILLAGYDNNLINHGDEFTFASAGYGSDVSQFPNGRMVWFNYRTASGNLDGNISSYKFGDGKGGELAEISNGQFSGNAASATKALKVVQGNNDRLVTNANGVTVVGGNNNSTIGFRTDGSAHYEPYIMTRKTLDGNNSAEFHLDYYTANGGHHFKDATSGYADVYAKSFVANGSSNDYVLLGGGGTKAVSDFVQNNANQIAAKTIAVLNSDDTNGVYIHWDSNGYLNIHGDTAPPRGYVFDAPVTQSSDARLKNIVSHAGFEVDKLATLPLVWFTWKKDERRRMHFGSIAQEWQKVLPEVVSENGDGMLAMDYGAAAMAAGVTACREVVALKKEIEELKEIIRELKNNK